MPLLEDFEEFVPAESKHTYAKAPFVSIGKSGRICLNISTCALISSDNYTYCTMLFNPTTQQIAFRMHQDENGTPIKKYEDGVRVILARPFCKTYRIDISRSRKYPIEWDEATATLIIGPVVIESD